MVSSSLPLDSIPADSPEKCFYEVPVCSRIKAAIASGIIDPLKLAEAARIPVCIAAKRPDVNSITAAVVIGQLEEHRRNQHFREQADKLMNRPKRELKGFILTQRWFPGFHQITHPLRRR